MRGRRGVRGCRPAGLVALLREQGGAARAVVVRAEVLARERDGFAVRIDVAEGWDDVVAVLMAQPGVAVVDAARIRRDHDERTLRIACVMADRHVTGRRRSIVAGLREAPGDEESGGGKTDDDGECAD